MPATVQAPPATNAASSTPAAHPRAPVAASTHPRAAAGDHSSPALAPATQASNAASRAAVAVPHLQHPPAETPDRRSLPPPRPRKVCHTCFGGGGTSGPTKGGFDCSGLTQYSVYKATGKTIPRTADVQYETSSGHHLPRGQAQKGDLIFWATGGNCASAVEHVGIYISPGLMINAATTGTPVREQSIWTSSGGLEICPDAVRFW